MECFALDPYAAIGRGRTFRPVGLKLLKIVTKAFVTFPEYMLAKMLRKIFQISPLVFLYGGWNMNTQLEKAQKSYVKGLVGF